MKDYRNSWHSEKVDMVQVTPPPDCKYPLVIRYMRFHRDGSLAAETFVCTDELWTRRKGVGRKSPLFLVNNRVVGVVGNRTSTWHRAEIYLNGNFHSYYGIGFTQR